MSKNIYIALVHDIFGHWTLPKGSIKEGEDEKEGTIRKVKEEIGSDIVIKSKIGENEYVASHPEKGKIRKHVSYFIAEAPYQPLKLEDGKGGLDDVAWFKIEDILELNLYNDMVPLFTKAVKILLEK